MEAVDFRGFVFLYIHIMSRSISVKKRFEVFKRDNFTCQYCSAKPPLVPLEIDHIQPICKGGNNTIDNLITACFDCNRGKAGNELGNVTDALVQKIERMKLAKLQYNQYKKLLKKQKTLIDAEIETVDETFTKYFNDRCLTEKFKISSVKKFITGLGVEEVIFSMEKACERMEESHDAVKYFCGICWNKIRDL